MRVVAQKADLVEALSIVNRAVSSRSSLQVLSGVLLEAKDEGITVSGTDMEISIKAPMVGRVEEAGRRGPAGAHRHGHREESARRTRSPSSNGRARTRWRSAPASRSSSLHAMQASDFPQFPVFPLENGFTLEKDAFLETIDRVAPSASKDETRPVLTGVLIHVTQEQRQDGGHRQLPAERQGDGDLDLGRPIGSRPSSPRARSPNSRASGAASSADRISVVPSENQVLFDIGGISLISRLIDGQFPNYRQLLPERFEHEVEVDREEFMDVVRRVGLLAQRNAPMRLRFADNSLTVSAESQDVGQGARIAAGPVRGRGTRDRFQSGVPDEGLAAVTRLRRRARAADQSAAARRCSRVTTTTSST